MAELAGNLWEYNLTRVIFIDVTDDYRLMQPPLPSDCYPILQEVWLPRHNLSRKIASERHVNGYLYDWHESPDEDSGSWYVGVVSEELARVLESAFLS